MYFVQRSFFFRTASPAGFLYIKDSSVGKLVTPCVFYYCNATVGRFYNRNAGRCGINISRFKRGVRTAVVGARIENYSGFPERRRL